MAAFLEWLDMHEEHGDEHLGPIAAVKWNEKPWPFGSFAQQFKRMIVRLDPLLRQAVNRDRPGRRQVGLAVTHGGHAMLFHEIYVSDKIISPFRQVRHTKFVSDSIRRLLR